MDYQYVVLLDKRMIEDIVGNNGFDYVDLELPNSTLWATCNVGASNPSESGFYFQWGDTKGYSKDQCSTYNWDKTPKSTKYTTYCATLELEDDAAHVCMGGSWHIPSPEQIKELVYNTTNTFTKLNGIKGMKFTSKNGKFIFIPAAGYAFNDSILYSGSDGNIWLSMLYADDVNYSQYFYFYSGGKKLDSSVRCIGLPVRGVIG